MVLQCMGRMVEGRELTEATGLEPAASCVTGRRPKPGCSGRQRLRGSFSRRCESIKDKDAGPHLELRCKPLDYDLGYFSLYRARR